ncbi:cytochrome c-type biogenesis protein [Lentibacter sp.]|uniref:cytochrome c-type biogenesis protein n=1 Tax=Lentibacter sp. TaxID=2024994 RepID=UPI003F69CDA1
MRWFLVFSMLWIGPVFAVQPDEILSDPRLEERARDLSRGLRCLVCRNENIDDSNAELARDLRLLVRERLVAGDSNDEVLEFVVSRYGEYVLLNPTKGGSNMILYYAGPAMLLLALLIGGLYLRARAVAAPSGSDRLSSDEAERLKRIMEE